MKKSLLVYLILALSLSFMNANAQIAKNKIAGVCFRVDDQQPINYWQDYYALFKKYNLNFCMGQNLDTKLSDTAYLNQLRNMSLDGNELMDHSPSHSLVYITVKNYADTLAYSGNPNVDHIKGKRVCLAQGEIIKSTPGNGLVDLVNGNMLITHNNGAFSNLGIGMSPYFYSIYIPDLNGIFPYVFLQNLNPNDPDTLTIKSYWDESIVLANQTNLSFSLLGPRDVKLPIETRKIIAQRAIDLANSLNFPTPKTVVLPSGPYPLLVANDIKEVWGDLYNYTASNSGNDWSYKCYKEFNPDNLKRWSITWGDFTEERVPFSEIKHTIANKVARHYVQFNQSHFYNPIGGWSGYINRMDSLLFWLKDNNIPVKTYHQWSSLLFDSIPDPYTNIFPSPGVDLDKDGLPDGYYISNLDTTDGVAQSNYKSIAVNGNQTMFEVQDLTGIEVGSNSFSAYTKGAPGDSINVRFTFYGNPIWIFRKIPADQANWTKYTVQFDIPDSLTRMSINATVSDYISGNVKISGMELRKLSKLKLNAITGQSINANENFAPIDLNQYVNDPLFAPAYIHFQFGTSNHYTFSIDSNNILTINKTSPFFIGKDSVLITGINPDNSSDAVYLTLETTQPAICYGDNISLSVDPFLSVSWSSIPTDNSLTNINNTTQLLSPKVNTTYTATCVSQTGDTSIYLLDIIVHQLPNAEAGNDITVCYNDNIKLSAIGGVQYLWNNGVVQDQYFNINNQAYYTVKVLNEYGCYAFDSLFITVNPIPNVGVFDNSLPICYNSTTTLHVNNTSGTINWQVLNANQWVDINGATQATYTTPLLTSNTSYRIKASNTNCTVYSSVPITVVVNPVIEAGYLSSAPQVCLGTSATITISGNNGNVEWQSSLDGINAWTVIGTSDRYTATFNTPYVNNNAFYRARVSNDNCGEAFTSAIEITTKQASVGGNISVASPICIGSSSTLNLNNYIGNIQWQYSNNKGTSWMDMASATSQQAVTSALMLTTYFRAKVNYQDCPFAYSNTDSVLVDSLSSVGIISGTSTVCQGSSVTLTLSGNRGAILWQQSTDSINWQTASGVISNTSLLVDNINTSSFYRTVVTNGSCQSVVSYVMKINVDSMSTGGFALANSPICTASATSISLNNYKGTIQWQVSWNSGTTWANISSTNTSAKTPLLNLTNQTSTGYYRATVKNGVCPMVYSAIDTVVVNSHSVGGSINVISPICQNKTTKCYAFSYFGQLAWQESTDNINWNDVTTGSNFFASPYTTPNLINTMYYRVKVTNGACPSVYSTVDTAIVNEAVTPVVSINISNGYNPQYAPADTVTFNASITNGGSNPVYLWKNNGITIGSNNDVLKYIPANNDIIKCQLTSNALCATTTSVSSNSITMSINNNPVGITGTMDAVAAICYNSSTLLHISYCNGSIQWQQLIGTDWTDINGAISAYYQTPSLTNTTQYRVAVSFYNYPVYYMNPVTVTVYPQTNAGVLTSAPSVCSGSTATLNLSNHNGSIEWQSSADGINNWTTIGLSGINNPTFSTSPLLNTTYFRAKVTNANCDIAYSNIDSITIIQSSFNGSINAISPVCMGNNSTITLTGSFDNLQWQSSYDKNTWNDIAGANNAQLITDALLTTTYYRAKISYLNCALIYTNIDSVKVDSSSIAGVLSGNGPICQGSALSLTLSNYRGAIQWQQSADSINWQVATGNATNNTFNCTPNSTTYFRTLITSGSCPAVAGNVKKINVDASTNGGTAVAVSPVCTGSSTTVTLNSYIGSIQWQVSWNSGTTWANVTNATSALLNLTNQTSTAYYRASVKNGVCPVVYSVYDTVLVNANSSGGTVNALSPICSGKTTTCYLYGYLGQIQWQTSSDNSIWNNVTSGTNQNASPYTTPALSATTYYRAKVTNGACASAYSTTGTVLVNPNVIPTVSISITSGINPQTSPADTVKFTAVITNGGATPVYQWKNNGINIGTNSNVFKYIPLNNDLIKCNLTSNAVCASPTSITSNGIAMVVSKPKSAIINQVHYNYQTVCLTDKPFALTGFTLCKYRSDISKDNDFMFDPIKYGYGIHDISCNFIDNERSINDSIINRITVVNCNDFKTSSTDYIVYPNPTSNTLNIIVPNNPEELTITINDLNNRTIYTKNYKAIIDNNNMITINTSAFIPGVYSLMIICNNINTVKKLIIAR